MQEFSIVEEAFEVVSWTELMELMTFHTLSEKLPSSALVKMNKICHFKGVSLEVERSNCVIGLRYQSFRKSLCHCSRVR